MDRLQQDLRHGLRTLRRSPLFTLTVIATLGVGIGANTAIFSFVDAQLLRPLPYGNADRLVAVWQDFSGGGGPAQEWFTPPDFADLRAQSRTLDAVAMYAGWTPNLTGTGEPERLQGARVSAEYFSLLGVAAALGRGFTEEDGLGDGRVVMLSDGVWRRRFGGDPRVIGATLMLNDEPFTVVGVLPPGFAAPLQAAEIWRPATPTTFSAGCGRGCYVMRVLGRLAPGTTLEQASAELVVIARGITEQAPGEKVGFTLRAVPLREQLAGPLRPALLALLGAVALLLLIACVNIANLLLARSAGREREVALRLAIGAGRGTILRQLLTESVLLGVIGGMVGVVLAYWGVELLAALSPPGTPRIEEVAVDARALGFAFLLSIVTGVLFGLAPALQVSRPDLMNTLKEGGPRSSGARRRLRSVLVVTEIAIAMTLLVGAGLLMRSFVRLQSVDPGFRADNVLTANLLPPTSRYPAPPQYNQFFDDLLERVRARGGVEAAGASSIVPLSGSNTDVGFLIEGRTLPRDRSEAPVAWYRSVTPDYFRAMGMRLVRGREFTQQDRADAPGVVVINETMARRYWPDEDPIGKRISADGPEGPWTTIVGIIADVRHNALDQDPLVEMYLPHLQVPSRSMTVVARTAGDPLVIVPALRDEVRALDPELPLGSVSTLAQAVSRSVAMPRLYLSFFGFFAAVALLLAAIGIYGVTAYAVSQRTQEIGIRMALGARGGEVQQMIVGQAMVLVAVGLMIGVAAALALSRALAALLFDLSPADPATFLVITVVLIMVALLASWAPARKATRVHPVVALRRE